MYSVYISRKCSCNSREPNFTVASITNALINRYISRLYKQMPERHQPVLMSYPHPKFYCLPLLCLLGLLLLPGRVCHAQEVPAAIQDSTLIDTTRQRFDDRVIDNLKKLSERKTIMGKLLKAVLVFDRVDEEVYGLDAELIRREYEKHTYKIVRRIYILSLDVYG